MASMRDKYGNKNGSFAVQLADFIDMANEAIDMTIKETLIVVGSNIITISPVDTGAFKANWRFGVGSAPEGTVEDVDPTGQQAIQRLVAQINAMDMGQIAYLVNNLPYAIPLEYGHSEQARNPDGMVRVTLARLQQIVAEAAARNRV